MARAPAPFCCPLDEPPAELVPHRLRQAVATAGPRLFVNPSLIWQESAALPAALGGRAIHREGFLATTPIAWVEEPGLGTLLPFWTGPKLTMLIDHLRPGRGVELQLDRRQRDVLHQTHLLVDVATPPRSRREWDGILFLGHERYRRDGYAPLPSLLHSFHLAALRAYYRRLLEHGAFTRGDRQSDRRYVYHNEPVTRFFHHQLTAVVSRCVGEPVKASYCYVASYQAGAELPRHTDRVQCEFSLTMLIDYVPEPSAASPWPLYLDTSTGTTTVYQALGDALLYRGRELPHYRTRLVSGHTSTSIFLHYVRADFQGSLG